MEQKPASDAAFQMRNASIIDHYHAHIYYDPASRERAARVREGLAAAFPDAVIGRWHDQPVGPHTQAMYQVAFATDQLAVILPWLMLNRDGLSVLVHPGTGSGNGYIDHTQHAAWLGAPLPLNPAAFKRGPGQGLKAEEETPLARPRTPLAQPIPRFHWVYAR